MFFNYYTAGDLQNKAVHSFITVELFPVWWLTGMFQCELSYTGSPV